MCKYCKHLQELRNEERFEYEHSLRRWKACCHRQDHLLRLAVQNLIMQNNELQIRGHSSEGPWKLIYRIMKELRKDIV